MTIQLANTITADMGLIPGLAFVGPAMGLPLSVLAAFIERPFYTLAGVRRQTIWYSLQANLVSLAAGFVATMAAALVTDAMRSYDALYEAWPFLAVGVSIVVERAYLRRRTRGGPVKWAWTAAANVPSAAACVGLLYLVVFLRSARPDLRGTLAPFHGVLEVVALVGSAVLFVVAFSRTRARDLPPVDEPF